MPSDDLLQNPELAWAAFKPSKRKPFDVGAAAHLFRRATFGATIDQIDSAVADGLEQTLANLFVQIDKGTNLESMDGTARLVSGSADAKPLAAWWLLRMIKSNTPFVEKMTLFWHGHFATGAGKVQNARAMLRQNQLLRKHAFGKLEPLVKEISSDVAMLVYLDSEENRRTRPNENYARELMELFCLGPGNYSEHDIKEVARCFTGWTVRQQQFRFNEHDHDKKEKTFFGNTGNYDGNEAVSIVLKQDAATYFIANKLIHFFVSDELQATPKLIEPLASHLRETNFDIRSTMRMLLSSNLFFSEVTRGQKIKSPVELAVGFLRFFDASTNVSVLANSLESLGQLPLFPPNVKGWEGGRAWINASTVLGRANLIADILRNNKTKFKAGSLKNWLARQTGISKVEKAARSKQLWPYLLPSAASQATFDTINEIANQSIDPQALITTMTTLPEFQLN